MAQIEVLDQKTIDKIAAGEVIERPASVVKELIENAIDAGASAVTVEIKDGGISFLRITDNGCGIEMAQASLAFIRHSTSKIKQVEDLFTVTSLGFRGEALSSIAAVSKVELITKTAVGMCGIRYLIAGGDEVSCEEIGAPLGTTFIVRDLFYNTPVRKKFLKSPTTEGGYISELVQRLALSHPEVSFKYIVTNKVKLHTSGDGDLKAIIYHIYGREVASNLIKVQKEDAIFSLTGFIGKPSLCRGNRTYENYFINGRYVKSDLIATAIEAGYKSFLMQHKYPFTVLNLSLSSELLDVNVHPTKMELRFRNQEEISLALSQMIHAAVTAKELIPPMVFEKKQDVAAEKKILQKERQKIPEPFEEQRIAAIQTKSKPKPPPQPPIVYQQAVLPDAIVREASPQYSEKLISPVARKDHQIIGQLFETYWLVEFKESLYIIDQHAAHEKVLFERIINSLSTKEFTSQTVFPPLLLTLNVLEEDNLNQYMEYLIKLGYEISHFGGKEYSITAIPGNLFGLNAESFILEVLDCLPKLSVNDPPAMITEKIASMSCKAAVKGNQKLSQPEMEKLMDDLLTLENPYHCPHGRPTIVSMTKTELDKKFKRVL
jgi:DNA mismatch repair protein MutL